ncbi:MAG: OmpA family protein [Thiobacillus sp.]|jgi:outer membrane protein OmpA-like peptidoglycan-associated protein|nr:OmpA family protein [Thiobacillus sp.]
MKCMFALLALVWAGSSMAADWQVTQSDSISAYVMCHAGDCPVRTAKVLDLAVPVPMPAMESDSAAKPVAVSSSTSVRFALASARLSQTDKAKLKAFLERHRDARRFLILGSTDQVGKKRFNETLAYKRGIAVAVFMHANGVQKRNIKVDSRCCIDHPPSTNPGARRAVISINE